MLTANDSSVIVEKVFLASISNSNFFLELRKHLRVILRRDMDNYLSRYLKKDILPYEK